MVSSPSRRKATGLGAGVYEPGRRVACSIIGTTGAHLCVREDARDIVLSNQSCYTMPCVAPDTWVQLCSNMAATLNLEWFIKSLNQMLEALGEAPLTAEGLLPRLDAALAGTEPGRLIYHPFICANGERGPFFNPRARAQFLGLSTEVNHLHMARAIYEGVAFAARGGLAAGVTVGLGRVVGELGLRLATSARRRGDHLRGIACGGFHGLGSPGRRRARGARRRRGTRGDADERLLRPARALAVDFDPPSRVIGQGDSDAYTTSSITFSFPSRSATESPPLVNQA